MDYHRQQKIKVEMCIYKVGEIYSFLGVSKTSTSYQITDKFLRIQNRMGIFGGESEVNTSRMNKVKKNYYESLFLSFQILKNPDTRSIYDNEYYKLASLLNETNDNKKKKKKFSIINYYQIHLI
ncbi:hypothetical protein ACTFIW_002016 [Dictyostelium discoideum]